jgi:hypothetical protein
MSERRRLPGVSRPTRGACQAGATTVLASTGRRAKDLAARSHDSAARAQRTEWYTRPAHESRMAIDEAY